MADKKILKRQIDRYKKAERLSRLERRAQYAACKHIEVEKLVRQGVRRDLAIHHYEWIARQNRRKHVQ